MYFQTIIQRLLKVSYKKCTIDQLSEALTIDKDQVVCIFLKRMLSLYFLQKKHHYVFSYVRKSFLIKGQCL